MNNFLNWSLNLYYFVFLFVFFIDKIHSDGSSKDQVICKENLEIWRIIKEEIHVNEWLNVKNFPKNPPKLISFSNFECTDTCNINELEKKKYISKKCLYSVRQMLSLIESEKRLYSPKIKKGASFHEALARFCLKVAKIYMSKNSEKCEEKKLEIMEQNKVENDKSFKSIPNENQSNQNNCAKKKNTSKNSIKNLLSILLDYRNSLCNNKNLISQIRKSKQKQVSNFIKKKDWRGLAFLLSREPKEDVLSFLDVLIGTDESNDKNRDMNLKLTRSYLYNKNFKNKKVDKNMPFGFIPAKNDEWNAIVDWIYDNTQKTRSLNSNWMIKKKEGNYDLLKIPDNFVASQGVENVFITQCIKGLRSLIYKTHIAPNGDKYYSYNDNNRFGILIEGSNQYERNNHLKNACKIIFNKFYEYLGIDTKNENDEYKFRIEGKLNFLTPLEHDKIFLNKLLKSFYKLINDKRREWQAVVNEAKISPLVNSQDLPLEIVPYYFVDENIKKEMNLEKKEILLSDKCFETLEKMKDERVVGESDIPLYNIELGSEGKVSQAKFCKGVFERFITRHIEWLMIVVKSIDYPEIQLIDISDPYLDIPDVFLFPEDARLRENCITSLLVIFEKNTQAIENGFPVKVYPQVNYLGKPESLVENVTKFCEFASGLNKKNIRIDINEEEVTVDNSNDMSIESKLISLINKKSDQNLLIDFGINIEDRLDKIAQENPNLNTKRLEEWKIHFEEVSSLDSHGNSIIKLFQNQFSEFINYELNCEKKIKKYISNRNLNIEKNFDNSWMENYLMETDRLKSDWATELQAIENLQTNILAAQGELENYVNTVRAVIHGDEKQKELPQYKKILKEWPNELSSKERIYIKLKIDNLLMKQRHESNIEALRYEQLERRKVFKQNLQNSLNEENQEKPILFDLEYCMREDEDLYPVYPNFESLEEEKIRLQRIESINNVSEEFNYRFKLLNKKLNEQLVNLDSVLSKLQKDFLEAWEVSYDTALALQLQIRARNLVEEYVRVSERYLLIKRVRADYEYRRSIMNEFQTDPRFETMLNRASEMMNRAEAEELELKQELSHLSEQKNNLPTIVEQDMQNIYSHRLKTIRESKEFLKNRIEQEKKFLVIEEKIFEDQLSRDLEYYKIKDIAESAIYRAEQLRILYEATDWLLNFNEKLTISNEMQFREDLEKLDYVIPANKKEKIETSKSENRFNPEILFENLRKHKYKYNEGVELTDILSEQELKKEAGEFYNDDPNEGKIPDAAQTLLRIFKEKLILKLNDLDEVNQLILRLNLNTIGSFQYFDYNREKAYYSFLELPYKKSYSNLFAVILSHFEWEHIQLRWRAIQLSRYILSEKEKILNELSEMKLSLDIKMKKFNAIPLSRKLVPIGTLTDMESMMSEIIGGYRTSAEQETLEIIPSNIPYYLLSDDDYHKVRHYDYETKKVILTRIIMILTASEKKYLDFLKDIIEDYNKQKKINEEEIQSIKKKWDDLRLTTEYKFLSKEEKEMQELKYKESINKITESSNLLISVARKQVLLRKIDKIDLFKKKTQLLFQDPTFTGHQAKELEKSILEFYGNNSEEKYDEISPRIKLVTELSNLQRVEEQITELEDSLLKNKDQVNVGKLHKLKILKEDINKKIFELNKEVQNVTDLIQDFQNKHFKLVFEAN